MIPIKKLTQSYLHAFFFLICVWILSYSSVSAQITSKLVEDGGTGPYKALMISEGSLPTHTIFRPSDLTLFGDDLKLPII